MPKPKPKPKPGYHKREVALPSDVAWIQAFSNPFQWALIGKFSQGMPAMEAIHKFLYRQDFKHLFNVGLLDSRHVLINFSGEDDFLCLYSKSKKISYVDGKPMRLFKWSSDFAVDREPSIVPIWFKLPCLPILFFNQDALFHIASLWGNLLRLDSATRDLTRLTAARIQVEIDLLKPLPKVIWIGMGETGGVWQKVVPDEALPSYCRYCLHLGHGELACWVKQQQEFVTEMAAKVVQPVYHPEAATELDLAMSKDKESARKNLVAVAASAGPGPGPLQSSSGDLVAPLPITSQEDSTTNTVDIIDKLISEECFNEAVYSQHTWLCR